MDLNRTLRRQRERSMGYKNQVKAQADQVAKKLQDQQISDDPRDLVAAMYYLVGIVLHEEYGFGWERILRVYERIDDRLLAWQEGSKEAQDFRKILEEEVGIILPEKFTRE